MKNLGSNRKESFVFVLVTFMLVLTMNSFANGFELMEPKSVSIVSPSNFDFLVNYDVNEYVESELKVEEWMFDVAAFVGENEEELGMEGWMTDVNAFLPFEECDLVLESWMVDVESFFSNDNQPLALK